MNDEPVPTIISVFRRASRLMVDDLVERIGRAGYGDLSASVHPLFENIDPFGTRLTDLAASAGMTHQSMGGLVDEGYLERRPDPSDGRARLVCLTDEGRRLARRAIREITAIEAEWQEHLADAGLAGAVAPALAAAVDRVERARRPGSSLPA